ncbi:MAG: hypothetical protein JHC41_00055 [Nitrosopumilus sp.]|nr:hypothetical protein [Nitrosopumilus sp.]
MNIGKDAGKTIFHCHIHLIPRIGDVSNPEGRVRNIISEKEKWKRWQMWVRHYKYQKQILEFFYRLTDSC